MDVTVKKIFFGEKCFEVEVAHSLWEQAKGLMFRRHLDPDKGMLFVFGREKIVSFWMLFTFIPLDIIWLDSDGVVVDIYRNARSFAGLISPIYTPKQKAKYALEINAGNVQNIGIKIGDRVDLNNLI